MFIKPFKVKSNIAIKGSDRKKLKAQILKQWPQLGEENVSSLVPSKGDMSVVKIVTHSGETVTVYTNAGDPIVIECGNEILPTVYTLWKFPDILPTFTTPTPVLQKLQGGADLMLAGVLRPYPQRLQKGCPSAVRLESNKAPIGVGKTLLDSYDMYMSGMRGKGIGMIHVYRDELWALGTRKKPPNLGPCQTLGDDQTDFPPLGASEKSSAKPVTFNTDFPPLTAQKPNSDVPPLSAQKPNSDFPPLSAQKPNSDFPPLSVQKTSNDFPTLGSNEQNHSKTSPDSRPSISSSWSNNKPNPPGQAQELISHEVAEDHIDEQIERESEEEEDVPELTMEELLKKSFLRAWKTSAKKIDLPILTSNFYRVHMVPALPSEKPLDIKKSKYKKLSKFLYQMEEEEFIVVKEQSKGVESITAVNREHPQLLGFRVEKQTESESKPAPVETSSSQYTPPEVKEVFCITAAVLPLFSSYGYSKGDPISGADVRRFITEYVKQRNLQDETNKKMVKLNAVLSGIMKKDGKTEAASWVDIFNRVPNEMTLAYIISHPDEQPILKKGHLPNINFSVQTRAGNKKMTIVTGLPAWGLKLPAVAKIVQTGVASSASATTTNDNQVALQVQGDQRKFLAKLFIEEFKIPQKYLKGLDGLPLNKKKK